MIAFVDVHGLTAVKALDRSGILSRTRAADPTYRVNTRFAPTNT
jgi:hypothetical protein